MALSHQWGHHSTFSFLCQVGFEKLMTSARVFGLISAGPCFPPTFARKVRSKGAKAAGLRYEREVAMALPSALHGQWFTYLDANGQAYCQPDLIFVTRQEILVLEVKLKWTPKALDQLTYLYLPILSHVYARPVRAAVITKILTPSSPPPCHTIAEALLSPSHIIPLIHWLGTVTLLSP